MRVCAADARRSCPMTIAEQLARIAGTLPESLAREALDFVRFLQARERGERGDWRWKGR